MTVHQLQGAIARLEAAKVEAAATQRTYMDIDDVSLEGARSDKDECDQQSLIKAIRTLNDFVAEKAIKSLHIDTDSDSPDYIQNGMVSWASFKQANRDLLKGLQASRKSTVDGPMGGRTGNTTGTFETMGESTREQVHVTNVPRTVEGEQVSVPAIARWEYVDDRCEWNSDGAPACWPYWAVKPVIEHDEDGQEIEVKAGIKHEKADEPIVMWRLKSLYLVQDEIGLSADFADLADRVHATQQTVKQNRRAERDAQLTPDNVENWTGTTDDLF